MTHPRIAITGATGGIGGRIARTLSAQGIATRLIVRDAARAPVLEHAEVAQAHYRDCDALVAATRGMDAVFMVSGHEDPNRLQDHKAAVDAFATAGVGRVVYTSFVNCAPDAVFTFAHDHYHTERYLAEKGLAFTALRDNFYADMVPRLITGDELRGPAGQGHFAPVARRDVADVAAAVLADPSAPTGAFDMTGPERMTLPEAVDIYNAVTGRRVRYVEETEAEAYASRAGQGTPYDIEGWVTSYLAIRAGQFDVLSDSVARFLGRPPLSLESYLRAEMATG